MALNPDLYNPHLEGEAFYWEGGATGILLSHGFTATSAEVRLLARILHDKGYTVAGPLLPGHGTTPEDCNRHSWREWLASVEAVYQSLKARCARVIVGGESTGAVLVLYLASQHPEIAGILAYAPALKLAFRRVDQLRLRLMAPFIPAVPKGSLDAANNWQGYPVNPLKGAVQLLNLQVVTRKRLPLIQQPILLMQGRLDTTVSAQAPQIIYDAVSSTVKELHWMENSAHTVIIDRELDQVAEITLKFIARIT